MGSFVWAGYFALIVAAGVSDLRTRRIPNRLTFAVLVSGFLCSVGFGDATLAASLSWGAVACGPLLAVHLVRPEGLGGGDVKLSAGLGVGLGELGALALLLALVAALAGSSLAARVRGLPVRERTVPLGPWMAAGALAAGVVG